MQEENARQSVLYVIGIFTFTLTARTNLMFIQHPHLQARILCLCPYDALLLSCGQSIFGILTPENKIISSALILKPKYYWNLSKFLKSGIKWTSLLAGHYGSTAQNMAPASDFFLPKGKTGFPGHCINVICMY